MDKILNSNALIEERDERTKKRKKIKRKMDAIIGLSYHDDNQDVISLSVSGTMTGNTARLLDEGYCDNGFILKKGTLEKYLNGQNQVVRGWQMGEDGAWEQTEVLNLTPDFKGTVNLGHMDFATFPILLGEWTRDDLKLVDIENERHALDIDMRLDEDSIFVKELRRQNHDIGVSAEFWYHINAEDTQNVSEMLGYWIPVIDEIFIFAYGLVGECGNVNSSGLELKGATMPNDINEVMNAENDEIEAENDEIELAEVTEVTDEAVELAEDVSEAVESAEEEVITLAEETEVTEVTEETEVTESEDEEGEVEETAEEDSDEDEADEVEEEDADFEQLLAEISDLRKTNTELSAMVTEYEDLIRELTEANAELKKTNRRITNKLQNEKEKKEKFLQNARGISAKLFPNEEVEVKNNKVTEDDYLFGDGIGDL